MSRRLRSRIQIKLECDTSGLGKRSFVFYTLPIKLEKKDVMSKKVAWVVFYADSTVKLISSFGLGLIRFIAQKVGRNGLFSLCILFRSHERTKQSSGERLKKYGRRRKK